MWGNQCIYTGLFEDLPYFSKPWLKFFCMALLYRRKSHL